ncbi:MAG: DNA gyrase inhibitor YacG [Pseudobdellovibrio sp.]
MDNSDDNTKSNLTPNERYVRCPQCGLLALFSAENPSRPFCSDRCRLIDLGQWADQSYKIPVPIDSIEILELLDDAEDSKN